MDIYDIYTAFISWGEDGKQRPVLILEHSVNAVTVFNITTRYEDKSEAVRSKYFKINDWQQAGLNRESYIDTNGTVTLPQSSVERFLGTLTEADVQGLLKFLVRQT